MSDADLRFEIYKVNPPSTREALHAATRLEVYMKGGKPEKDDHKPRGVRGVRVDDEVPEDRKKKWNGSQRNGEPRRDATPVNANDYVLPLQVEAELRRLQETNLYLFSENQHLKQYAPAAVQQPAPAWVPPPVVPSQSSYQPQAAPSQPSYQSQP